MIIEKTVLDYLTPLTTTPVYTETPENPTGEYIIIEKTGERMNNQVWGATIAVQSHADSLYDAAELNEEVTSLMLAITQDEDISKCDLTGSHNFTNPRTKKYRYQAVFELAW